MPTPNMRESMLAKPSIVEDDSIQAPSLDYDSRVKLLEGAPLNPEFTIDNHLEWARIQQSRGREEEARRRLAKNGFNQNQIDASFLPHQHLNLIIRNSNNEDVVLSGEERAQRASDMNFKIRQLNEKRDQLLSERDSLSKPDDTPESFQEDTQLFQLTEKIGAIDSELQDLAYTNITSLAQRLQANADLLSQPLFSSNPALQAQKDAAVQESLTVLKMLSPYNNPDWDDDSEQFLINGEPIESSIYDMLSANANLAAVIGGSIGAGATARNIQRTASAARAGKPLRATGGFFMRGSIGLGILTVGSHFAAKAEQRDVERALNFVGMKLSDSAARAKYNNDLALGIATGLGASAITRYAGGAAVLRKIYHTGKVNLMKLIPAYTQRVVDTNAPARKDILKGLQNSLGIDDEALDKGFKDWVDSLADKGETTISVNNLGFFGKVALKAGFKDAVIPSKQAIKELTEDEQQMAYLLYTNKGAIGQIAKALGDNYALPTRAFTESAANRTKELDKALKNESIDYGDLQEIQSRISVHIEDLTQQIARERMGLKPEAKMDFLSNNFTGELNNTRSLLRGYMDSKTPKDKKIDAEQVIGVNPELLKAYKDAVRLKEKGLGKELTKVEDLDDAVAAFKKFSLSTNTTPDYNTLTSVFANSPEKLRKIESAIIASEIDKVAKPVQGTDNVNIDWFKLNKKLGGVQFKTDKGRAIYERVRENAIIYRNDIAYAETLNVGSPIQTRIGSGFATTAVGRFLQKVISIGTYFVEVHVPGTTKHTAIGFENVAFRFFTDDPISQKSIKYTDALIRDAQKAQGATKQ